MASLLGRPPKIKKEYVMRPLSTDEETTCESIMKDVEGGCMIIMPTHHISRYGDLCGFEFQCEYKTPANFLPISRRTFFGHTIVECDEHEETIWKLIINHQRNGEKMGQFLERIKSECTAATLGCIPDAHQAFSGYHTQDVLTQDSAHWSAEVPESIGIYHAMVRSHTREVREHKLYIVCSGGMRKAADEFCNLLIDVGHKCDAETVAISEEAWWLKKASNRARCDLIYQLAKTFSIKVPTMQDFQSKEPRLIATHSMDTVCNDIVMDRPTQRIRLLNECCDTSRCNSGAVVQMHPAEGYWLFRSADKSNRLNDVSVFPTHQPMVNDNAYSLPVRIKNGKIVYSSPIQADIKNYMCFDEQYFQQLQAMKWNRNNGITELIPIVVGIDAEFLAS